ncbi:MAG TPA: ABC transporter substrate-binding protein, partial [Pseudolabrys sp.]|nr:ABC transporter substrate-binding protein [Pseudolabrys sp.]
MANIATWRALGFVAAAATLLTLSPQWAGASSASMQLAQAPNPAPNPAPNAAPSAAPKPGAAPAQPAAKGPSLLRVVPHAPLVVLDPTWTSIYITRNHGYMIYDTLFAIDAEGKPRPQMVDTWETSSDGLTWTFKLRDGLKWHDGADVTAEDCIASLKRWSVRGGEGQLLFSY